MAPSVDPGRASHHSITKKVSKIEIVHLQSVVKI